MISVSIIIPVYGVEKHIERSLTSLFTQTKSDGVEYILVNDCTPDRSIEIAQRVIAQYPNLDIKIVNHTKNLGLAGARETGMGVAQGEYVLHIDSDDWCEPRMVEMMYEAALRSGADIVVSDFYIDHYTWKSRVHQTVPQKGDECVDSLLNGGLHGSVWSKLFRRSLFTQNNLGWVQGISLWEDLLICAKVFCYAKSVYHLQEPFVHYMQHEGSICSVASPSKLKDVRDVVDNLDAFYLQRGLGERYNVSLGYRKLQTKNFILTYSQGKEQKEFSKLYLDQNSKIMSMPNLSLDRRIALKFASSGMLGIFRLILSARTSARKLRKKL